MADASGDLTDKQEKELDIEQEAPEVETFSINELQMENLKNQAEDYKDKYFRVLAESENSRKRLIKERQDMVQYALQHLLCEFLTPIDQMESALKHCGKMSDEVKQWSMGFQMILTHFKDVLANNNVQSFDSVGKEFDPHIHEGVETVETTEYPDGTVVEESLRGYKMGDKVIRPSRVKVAKAPSEKREEGQFEQNEKKI